jgi:hypothetical protein
MCKIKMFTTCLFHKTDMYNITYIHIWSLFCSDWDYQIGESFWQHSIVHMHPWSCFMYISPVLLSIFSQELVFIRLHSNTVTMESCNIPDTLKRMERRFTVGLLQEGIFFVYIRNSLWGRPTWHWPEFCPSAYCEIFCHYQCTTIQMLVWGRKGMGIQQVRKPSWFGLKLWMNWIWSGSRANITFSNIWCVCICIVSESRKRLTTSVCVCVCVCVCARAHVRFWLTAQWLYDLVSVKNM